MSQEGFWVLLWDIKLGSEYDLLLRKNQRLIAGWVRGGGLDGAHQGIVCTSWSRARDQGPPGPRRVRSDAFVLGLPDLEPHEQAEVDAGNEMMRFGVFLCLLLRAFLVPWSLENPARSRFWLAARVLRLARMRGVCFTITDMCQWGTPWMKPTGFLTWGLSVDSLAKRCCGAKRGVCARTGRSHVVLRGLDKNGRFKTGIASAYPHALCKCLARCYYNAKVSSLAEGFQVGLSAS